MLLHLEHREVTSSPHQGPFISENQEQIAMISAQLVELFSMLAPMQATMTASSQSGLPLVTLTQKYLGDPALCNFFASLLLVFFQSRWSD